ncbi:MAG: 3-phosphoshikimate 1-carboxyvinyltransferase, partial [Flavobacteriaceae bacterium]|nr:3-phosphoshikimate 1-carboxyvinyltransferase [Flavobacteriaceae bacterium]
ITGTSPSSNEVSLEANVSSQYISALLLMAPTFEEGLQIQLENTLTSAPYVKMTLSLLEAIGASYRASENTIEVQPLSTVKKITYTVESDWSSVSYLYSWVAISKETSLRVSHYKNDSLQGDRALVDLFAPLGVETSFEESSNRLLIKKVSTQLPKVYSYDLSATPDIAQTLAVTCFALGIAAELTGLHTLKIKETDRLLALETELKKFGASISVTDESLSLKARDLTKPLPEGISIATYQDHRMAMAFAPLALCCDITIEEPKVVEKSYPTFWEDMETLGMSVRMNKSSNE